MDKNKKEKKHGYTTIYILSFVLYNVANKMPIIKVKFKIWSKKHLYN